MNDETMDDDEFYVSKTKRKQAMNELQDMGGELVKLGNSRLAELKLPEELLTAVLEAKRITSNGATRRQIQYIGRLMRDVDVAPIKAKLDAWSGNSKAEAARFHRLERWRERLLTDESSLPEFITEYPAADVQQIATDTGILGQILAKIQSILNDYGWSLAAVLASPFIWCRQ